MSGSSNHTNAVAATQIVREHINPRLEVLAVRCIHTGPVNVVYEWHTDGEPADLIAKICPKPNDLGLHQEMAALRWYRANTAVPVPETYACVTELDSAGTRDAGEVESKHAAPASGGHTCLVMQRLPGRNLTEARLNPSGKRHLQVQLAKCVRELHSHRRDTYGNGLASTSTPRWLDRFQPAMSECFDLVRDRLSARSRWAIGEIVEGLDRWLPEFNEPTLIHGDLWANNILVDDHDPARPVLTGLIDGGVNYSDVEYELAYLRGFTTVDQTFFDTYCTDHPLRSGFDRRCRVYWLYTAMRHTVTYDPAYLDNCERMAKELSRFL